MKSSDRVRIFLSWNQQEVLARYTKECNTDISHLVRILVDRELRDRTILIDIQYGYSPLSAQILNPKCVALD